MSTKEKQEYAYLLYSKGDGITLEEIATKCGVHVNTISRWKKANNWRALSLSLQMTRYAQLKNLYLQYQELNASIMGREKGKRFPIGNEADRQAKIVSQIDKLQKELSIEKVVDVFGAFLNWLGKLDTDMARNIVEFQDLYIKSIVK